MIRKVISYKLWVISFAVLLFFAYNLSLITHNYCFAQDNNKLVELTKQIMEAKIDAELYLLFKELKDFYFKDNKYAEMTDFLKSLVQKKKKLEPFTSYYIALSRYRQLKYLEETQSWDEYFANGNTYREEISKYAQKTLDLTGRKDILYLYSRLLLWQFHHSQQDMSVDSALSDLMSSVSDYSKGAQDLSPIREIAEQLQSGGEKGKSRELYRIYADRIIESKTNIEDLKDIALGFYKEGNLDLSESIYDVYIDRITADASAKEKMIPVLIDIAKDFSYKDDGQRDPLYAEKVFERIEKIGVRDAFDEELMYLRAYNLEKMKEWASAGDIYVELIQSYPKGVYAERGEFRAGIIHTYILRNEEAGRRYFAELTQRETVTPYVISSLYQLGLLAQWEQDFSKAKEFYNKLLERAGSNFQETVILAQERLREIDELKPIEYNLKTFLDISLKEEFNMFDMTKIDLASSRYNVNREEVINISAATHTLESGSIPIELQYLWSGDLGLIKPANSDSSFSIRYLQPGTKQINLVVVSPSGIIDRNIDLVDVE